MFKPFFEEEADDLDNRGTVILHELAHMIGLNSEKELNDIKSAESLRNFILLVTKKVSKEALLESIKNAPPKLKLATSVFAYSPDQPRDPKGTPTGGQWSSDDNNSSNQNGKSEDDSKTSKSDKETQSEETKEEKSEESEENTESETKENPEDSESKELDENKQKILDSIIEANADQLDKLSQSEQEAFKEAITNELKGGGADTTNSLKDKLNTLIKDTLQNGVKLASTDLSGLKSNNLSNKAEETVSKERLDMGYKTNDTTLSSVGESRTSDKNFIALEDAIKFKRNDDSSVSAWIGISFINKNKNYKIGEKVPIVLEVEYEKNGKITKGTVLFQGVVNDMNEIVIDRIPILLINTILNSIMTLGLKVNIYECYKYNTSNLHIKSSNNMFLKYLGDHKATDRIEGLIENNHDILKESKLLYSRNVFINLPFLNASVIE